MKLIIAVMCFSYIAVAHSAQTKTECASMNNDREKILKDGPQTQKDVKSKKAKGM